MYVPLRIVAVCAALGLFVGCLQMDEIVTLEADGSGEATIYLAVSQAILEDAAGMGGMMPGMPGGVSDFAKSMDELKGMFEEGAFEGLSLQAYEQDTRAGWTFARFELAFASLDALYKTPLTHGQTVGLQMERGNRYKFTASDSGPGLPTPDMGDMSAMNEMSDEEVRRALEAVERDFEQFGGQTAPPSTAGAMQRAAEERMREMMQGFRLKRSLTVPGKIVSTSAQQQDDHTVVREVTFSEDFDPLAMATMSTDLEVVFEGEGIQLTPFRVRPEDAANHAYMESLFRMPPPEQRHPDPVPHEVPYTAQVAREHGINRPADRIHLHGGGFYDYSRVRSVDPGARPGQLAVKVNRIGFSSDMLHDVSNVRAIQFFQGWEDKQPDLITWEGGNVWDDSQVLALRLDPDSGAFTIYVQRPQEVEGSGWYAGFERLRLR